MRAETVGLSICVLALGLGARIADASAGEAEDTVAQSESTAIPVAGSAATPAEDTAAKSESSATAAATPGTSTATPAAAAAAPKLTTMQRWFGTFTPYKSYGDGATYTYQLVEKDGEKLYCQQEVITSTRVSKKGVCLTLVEMEAREAARRRNAEQFLRQGESSRTNPPPPDSSGGRYNNAVGGTNMPTP